MAATKLYFRLIILGLLLSINTLAQTHDEKKIQAVIAELFNAYRAGDSSRVAATFTGNAMIQTIYSTPEGNHGITAAESIDAFINYIGKGLTDLHDERIWDTRIQADEMLATVWTRYAFYLGDVFSHCGTEMFLLRKEDKTWKIFYLVDTRKKTGCKIPAEIKK